MESLYGVFVFWNIFFWGFCNYVISWILCIECWEEVYFFIWWIDIGSCRYCIVKYKIKFYFIDVLYNIVEDKVG